MTSGLQGTHGQHAIARETYGGGYRPPYRNGTGDPGDNGLIRMSTKDERPFWSTYWDRLRPPTPDLSSTGFLMGGDVGRRQETNETENSAETSALKLLSRGDLERAVTEARLEVFRGQSSPDIDPPQCLQESRQPECTSRELV